MKKIFSVIGFILSGLVLYTAGDDHGENSISYDKESFEKVVNEKKQFVMFFAPWCGHCKRLAPTWDELAKVYNVEGSAVTIGKVDCTVERALCADHGVKGYPTVKFFPKSKDDSLKYGNARTLEALKKFVEEQLSKEEKVAVKDDDSGAAEDTQTVDPEKAVYDLTADTFNKHVAKGHHFVKFFAPWCGHCKRLAPVWEDLGMKTYKDKRGTIAKVDCTKHSSVCKEFGIRGYPTLKWITDGQKADDYSGGRTIDDLLAYFNKMAAKEPAGDKLGTDGKVPDGKDKEDKAKPDKVKEAKVKEEEKPQEVKELTTDTFKDHVSKGQHFVKFFAPWCGHCKAMAPAWKDLANFYKSSSKVTITEVDCTKHSKVCSENKVGGYPTLLWFKDGEKVNIRICQPENSDVHRGEAEVEKYSQGRSLDIMKKYVESKIGQETQDIEDEMLTEEMFMKQIHKGYHFVLFTIPSNKVCKLIAPDWEKLTETYKNKDRVTVSQVNCEGNGRMVCDASGIEECPTMVWYKDGERVTSFTGFMTLNGLEGFVKTMLMTEKSIVKSLTDETADSFKDSISKGHHLVEFFVPWCEYCQGLAPVLEELAESLKDNNKVTVSKVDCSIYEHLCEDYIIEQYPTLKWFKDGELFDTESGVRSLEFLKEYSEKMLKQDGNPLYDLTSATFPNHIAKGSHFVKFFAPWCGHCKNLAPVWQELADNFKGVEGVSIAKVDCTVDRTVCTKYGVKGYPTLKFFYNGNEVEEYSGGRKLQALIDYVEKMVKAKEEEGDEPIMQLVPEEFEQAVEEMFTFVAFMQPKNAEWVQMFPSWEELAQSLYGSEDTIVASVDCKEYEDFCYLFHKVEQYPTLKLFYNGKEVAEYKGDKTIGGFQDFLEFQQDEIDKEEGGMEEEDEEEKPELVKEKTKHKEEKPEHEEL